MTKHEIKRFIKKAEEITDEVTQSERKSKEALKEAGIYTKKGNLRKPYNGKV